jgi:hypothetical protein
MPDFSLPSIPDKFKLTPEFRLLAACSWIAPPVLEKEQAEKIVSLCRGVIDWDVFVSLVRRHGVPALAYTMLSRHAGDMVPRATREILKASHVQSVGQALFQAAELVRLSELFSARGIDVIPLKGVFLSHQLYGDIGMRTSCDLDILVKPEYVDLADQIMEAEGYSCDYHGLQLTARQKQQFRTHLPHYDFTHSKSGLHVELHWNFGLWLSGQMTAFLLHTTRREWQGMSVDSLDDDATLLLLCEHGARHLWSSMKWLGDVARLLSSERSTGWDTLIALAAEFDLRRILSHSALMVHWVYGVTLPHELRTLIRQESLAASLSERALIKLLMSGGELAGAGKRAQKLRETLHMKRLRPSLTYSLIAKYCFVSPEDYQALDLPVSLFWLYYPLRPILWVWRNYISPRKGA